MIDHGPTFLFLLPRHLAFPPHGTIVPASTFICQYEIRSLLLFLFNASRTNNDFLLDTLSLTH